MSKLRKVEIGGESFPLWVIIAAASMVIGIFAVLMYFFLVSPSA